MRNPLHQPKVMDQFKITEVELIYRGRKTPEDRPVIKDPESAYRILLQSWDMNRIELVEEFKILLLNRASKCLGISTISSGGVSTCLVDPKIVFATALKARASSIVLAHNHPSGNLTPSQADLALTYKLTEGGKILDISVPDHLIVTPLGFYSMAENSLIQPC